MARDLYRNVTLNQATLLQYIISREEMNQLSMNSLESRLDVCVIRHEGFVVTLTHFRTWMTLYLTSAPPPTISIPVSAIGSYGSILNLIMLLPSISIDKWMCAERNTQTLGMFREAVSLLQKEQEQHSLRFLEQVFSFISSLNSSNRWLDVDITSRVVSPSMFTDYCHRGSSKTPSVPMNFVPWLILWNQRYLNMSTRCSLSSVFNHKPHLTSL